MLFQSIIHSRHAAPALLLAIILAAGGTIWEQGPGKARRETQRSSQNVYTMKQVDLAATMYAYDHDNKYPDADRWEQQLRPYYNSKQDYTLATEDNAKPHRIAINKHVAGRHTTELTSVSAAVLFFESTTSAHNAADDLQSLPGGEQSVAIGYADGHVYNHPAAWKQCLQEPRFERELLGELKPPKSAKTTAKS